MAKEIEYDFESDWLWASKDKDGSSEVVLSSTKPRKTNLENTSLRPGSFYWKSSGRWVRLRRNIVGLMGIKGLRAGEQRRMKFLFVLGEKEG